MDTTEAPSGLLDKLGLGLKRKVKRDNPFMGKNRATRRSDAKFERQVGSNFAKAQRNIAASKSKAKAASHKALNKHLDEVRARTAARKATAKKVKQTTV